ncbi:unnamed protein product [Cuscuta campestris]|uniref:Kinesin motor domain-containing protein n=1 Tax=Cuscuta campestris TaxID=132261 RepID=A0A484NA87_9ASTE|nr:unnamed protein product [Cuscuta campestris]
MEHISSPERLPASHSSTLTSKVRVVLRVRPFLSQEASSRNGNPVSCVASVLHPDPETSDEVTVHLKDHESRYLVLVFGYKCTTHC